MTEKLSSRVERLEGPSFTIEQEIGRLINPQATRLSVFPAYTASLDAAMSLVPEGWRISNFSQHDHAILRERGEWVCILYPDGRLDDCDRNFSWPRCQHAATPATALLAAALKARGL